MKRSRSPLYPALGLRETVDRVTKLHSRIGHERVTRGEALKGLGYGGANGASLAAISAARKYGLLARDLGGYRVTGLAEKILNPASQEERTKALEAAVRRPSIFAELVGAFRGQLPSDDELRAYLSTAGYSPTALPNVISSFRSSIDFATEGRGSLGVSLNAKALGADPFRVSIVGNRVEVSGLLTNSRSASMLIAAIEAAAIVLPSGTDSEDAPGDK